MGMELIQIFISRFTQSFMLKILDSVVPNQYDFFYMPVDFKTNCNLGFGYVSMIDSASVVTLYTAVSSGYHELSDDRLTIS